MANDQLTDEETAHLDLLLSVPFGEAVASFGARRVAAVALILGSVDEDVSVAERSEDIASELLGLRR